MDATNAQADDWWANRALALAAAYRAAGKPDDAIAALVEVADKLAKAADDEEARSARRYAAGSRGWVFGIDERFRFWVELGDLLVEQGRHKDAATRLEQGWRRYPDNPVLLYLSGRALRRPATRRRAAGERTWPTGSRWATPGCAVGSWKN